MAAAPAEPDGDANNVTSDGSSEVLPVPEKKGRLSEVYDVQKAVGKGGYAIVYKATRRQDHRVVAVKKVEIFEMSQKKRDRCLQEVKLLRQLNHPNIIQMLDAFIDENQLIIIFEWAPAGDLKRLIKKTAEAKKTFDEASIWTFFGQIADALRYMHQHRIMHRDIKPANVLVGANGALKLGDLGLGRQLSEQTMEAFSKVGTPYYVSPEVVRGAGYDWKSDVWSMGCLLYELARLRSPFEMEGANLYDVFQKISKGDYTPLPADTFSKSLRSLVTRMLSVEPSARPELSEVWSITRNIVNAQRARSGGRVDAHSASEELFTQLLLLEAHVTHQLSRQNGKRVELAVPPQTALRALHPLFFAEPLVAPGSDRAEPEQKRQLGAFMAVFAWLLRLVGRGDLADSVDEYLTEVALPRRTPRVPQPPPPSVKRSSSGGSGASRARHVAAAAHAHASPTPSPTKVVGGAPPKVPSAASVLGGAEAIKRTAQAAGLSTEFAPVNALALGYGRAVVAMLQDMLDAAWAKVQPTARRPQYHEAPLVDADDGRVDGSEPDNDAPVAVDSDDVDVVIGHDAPLPAALLMDQDDEEDAFFLEPDAGAVPVQQPASRLSALAPASSPAGAPCSSGRGSGACGDGVPGGRGSGPGRPVRPLADPARWYAEAERIAPQLSRIMLPAHVTEGATWGDWQRRVSELSTQSSVMHELAPGAARVLGQSMAGVSDDLERIRACERRLNASNENALMAYRAARGRLAQAQGHVRTREDGVSGAHESLHHLNTRLLDMSEQLQERAGALDGGAKIQAIQVAMGKLRDEMRDMDLRIGVVQQQLLLKQRHHMTTMHARISDESGDDFFYLL